MRLFLLDWFGWSFLWLLPLCGRVVLSLLAGRGLGGRGVIRVWLGTLLLLLASSALDALLRSQGNGVVQNAWVGQALAHSLSHTFGKLLTLVLIFASGLLGLFWLFGRPRQSTPDNEQREPAQPMVPSRRQQPQPLPLGKSFPPAASQVPHTGPAPSIMPFDYLQPKREPWPLPNALTTSPGKGGSQWPLRSTQAPMHKPAARPAAQWAPFESLRPTKAMLARSTAQPQPPAPRAALTTTSKLRVSTASDRTSAIATPLRTALQARQPQSTPLVPTIAPAPTAVIAPRVEVPENVRAAPADTPKPVAMAAAITPILPRPVDVIETPLPVEPSVPVFAPPVPMQIRSWTQQPASMPTAIIEAAAVLPYRRSDIPLPGIELLDQGSDAPVEMAAAQLQEIGQLIEQRLREFKVPVTVLGAYAGPVITRFEIEPALGVRGAQIVNLMKDLARALGVRNVYVIDPMEDVAKFEALIRSCLDKPELSVVIARRNCLLANGAIRAYERNNEQQAD